MEKLFSERIRVEKGLLGDIFGATESSRVGFEKANAIAIVVELGAGTGTSADFTLRQHDAPSAGNSADLISSVPVYHKIDADAAFTRLDTTTANFTIASLDTVAGTMIVEVYADDLAEGNTHVSLVSTAGGTVRVGSVSYMLDTANKAAYQIEL